jgi:hypothetical protein
MFMEVTFDSKGDFNNIERWLKEASTSSPDAALQQIATDGMRSLASHTPRDTGATANGWSSVITTKGGSSEIAWVNNAHPEAGVNIAVLIEQGHGTGTGGYVPPKPYIKKAMDSVFATAGAKIEEELIK